MLIDTIAPAALTAEEEAELVVAARELVGIPGFHVPSARAMDAKERLLAAYIPAIRSAVLSATGVSREDLEADLVERFLELVSTHDPERGRLASRLRPAFAEVRSEASVLEVALTVPARERRRFYHVLYVKAGGDFHRALTVADETKDYNRWRFIAVARALNTESLQAALADTDDHRPEEATPLGAGEGQPDTPAQIREREELAQWLLAQVTDRERLVLELGMGFTSPVLEAIRLKAGYKWDEELSDGQLTVIPEIGLTSRRSIIRERLAALLKMRQALDLAEKEAS
jgi:hypothetical protein